MERKVVFDFDGVLCEDENVLPLGKLADLLYYDMDFKVYIVTARPKSYLKFIEDFLITNMIPITEIIQMPGDEALPPAEAIAKWKVQVIKRLAPVWLVFEDCPAVVKELQKNDISVVGVQSDYWRGK